jgi:hypothetical protein
MLPNERTNESDFCVYETSLFCMFYSDVLASFDPTVTFCAWCVVPLIMLGCHLHTHENVPLLDRKNMNLFYRTNSSTIRFLTVFLSIESGYNQLYTYCMTVVSCDKRNGGCTALENVHSCLTLSLFFLRSNRHDHFTI